MSAPLSRVPRRLTGLWPLGLYTLLSVLLFGIPVLGHLDSRIVGSNAIDPSAYMWFLGWWPHALLHGLNPFVTHAIFYPDGYNLTWATSMPLPSLVLAPITLGFGPAVSWNVLQLLCPALSAWMAFLLCRHIAGQLVPSLIGGYVFGFSPYVLGNLIGAPNLGLVLLVPVFVLMVLRRLEGSTGPRRFTAEMTLALAAQYLISTEVLTTSTLFGGITLLLAYALFPERRAALLDVAKLLVVSYVAMAALISPFLYYLLFGHHYPPYLTSFPADIVSFVLPSPLLAVSRHGPPLAGTNTENYLGLPLIVLIGLFSWQERRRRTTWLVVLPLLVAAIFSLGGHVVVSGHPPSIPTSVPAPWVVFEHLPILRYVIPSRLGLFAALPAAMIVALWMSRTPVLPRGGSARLALVLLGLAFIVPNVGSTAWDTHITDPPFFRDGAYRAYLSSSDHVLTVPAAGENERWLAEAGFPFSLTAGYVGQRFPAGYTRYSTWTTLLTGSLTADYAAALGRFVTAKRVTAIVVDELAPGPWRTMFASLGIRPVSIGGVLLYRVGHRAAGGP